MRLGNDDKKNRREKTKQINSNFFNGDPSDPLMRIPRYIHLNGFFCILTFCVVFSFLRTWICLLCRLVCIYFCGI